MADMKTFLASALSWSQKRLESIRKGNRRGNDPYTPPVTVGDQKGIRVLLITVLVFAVLIGGVVWFILR